MAFPQGKAVAAAWAAPVALLALWQVACLSGLFPPQVLVPPSVVAQALADMAASGELQRHVGDSLYRLLVASPSARARAWSSARRWRCRGWSKPCCRRFS
ncbi:hypothetical protein [Sphingobium fuliginis]|uniref:hypothetical protein n=1 Tax=Sphingobium fuliginis (strain ATCC 27551) TaxID=336203 RepID=UPI00041FA9AD|nr:hypothetical protein [Sphingobium fuliginis]